MTMLSTFRNAGRAAVLALVLAGTAMSAMPAQAAPLQPLQGFSLDVKPQGGGPQTKQFNDFKKKQVDPNVFFDWCLTDKQIRRGLRSYGFTDIDIVGHQGKNRVRVEAAYGDWYYSMRINRCSGEVDRIRKLYPIWDDEDDFPF